jgi:hypothetical protein
MPCQGVTAEESASIASKQGPLAPQGLWLGGVLPIGK